MSGYQYAKRVRCDWPDCPNEGEVTLQPDWPHVEMPEGWTSFRPGLNMTDVYGRTINDFCPEHSQRQIADLPLIFQLAREKEAQPT